MNQRPLRKNDRRGAALVEFAIVALALYLLVFGGIELGRAIFISQVLQDAARIAARELALTPFSAGYTFDCVDPGPNTCVMNDLTVQANIWNPNLLVIAQECYPTNLADPTNDPLTIYLNSLPLVNRALRPALISETVKISDGTMHTLLRYPGALVPEAGSIASISCGSAPAVYAPTVDGNYANPWGLEVAIYRVNSDGSVNPAPVPVLAEVRGNPSDPACAPYGPFSFVDPGSAPPADCGADTPAGARGMVEIAVNYPFQSAALSGFKPAGFDANGGPNPNFQNVIVSPDIANDLTVLPGTYTGPNGLGNQLALGKTVRPYRIFLTGQAMFRREVTGP